MVSHIWGELINFLRWSVPCFFLGTDARRRDFGLFGFRADAGENCCSLETVRGKATAVDSKDGKAVDPKTVCQARFHPFPKGIDQDDRQRESPFSEDFEKGLIGRRGRLARDRHFHDDFASVEEPLSEGVFVGPSPKDGGVNQCCWGPRAAPLKPWGWTISCSQKPVEHVA